MASPIRKGDRPDVSERNERGAHGDPELDAPAAARRRRQLMPAIGEPHVIVTASSQAMPAGSRAIVCDRCHHVIDTPGVAIMRGRMVMHMRCDLRASAEVRAARPPAMFRGILSRQYLTRP